MHFIFININIAIIVIWQIVNFINTRKKISAFRDIFPKGDKQYDLGRFVEDGKAVKNDMDFKLIISKHKNSVLEGIVDSINNYLINNRSGVSDFHLMKDIVDRNCDAKEEEINAQIPVPLYLGLAGTMLGILIGVGFFVFSGGLSDLLNVDNRYGNNSSGADGIEMLLGGVALAMISSIMGIMLATLGSHKAKKAKLVVEENKNDFLSWIQAELLPNISTDTIGALAKMTQNLSKFNETFGGNTDKLQGKLEQINNSIAQQAKLIEAVESLKIGDLAKVNIQVYSALKNSTTEIGKFGNFLNQAVEASYKYLNVFQESNKKLDDYANRTKEIIENAGIFFKNNEKWLADNQKRLVDNNSEVQKLFVTHQAELIIRFSANLGLFEQSLKELAKKVSKSLGMFEDKKNSLADEFNAANLAVKNALVSFNKTVGDSFKGMNDSLNEKVLDLDRVMKNQNKTLEANLGLANEAVTKSLTDTNTSFEAAIAAQQKALIEKLQETPDLVEVLADLKSIKDSIQKDLNKAPKGQDVKIEQLTALTAGVENLTKEIKTLAKTNLDGNSMKQEMSIPRWLKILIISGGVLISIASLMFIIQILIN